MIEHADRLLCASAQADIERDVLVERVHLLRVVAHGVGGALAQEGLVLVEQARLLAKAVEAVLLLHARAGDDAVVAVQNERAAGDRPVQLHALGVEKRQAQRILFQHQLHRSRGKRDRAVGLLHRRHDGRHTRALAFKQRVKAILPRGRHQDVAFLRQLLVKGSADADDFVGHEDNLQVGVVRMHQIEAVLRLHTGKSGADFHGDGHSFHDSGYIKRRQTVSTVTCEDGNCRHEGVFSFDQFHHSDGIRPQSFGTHSGIAGMNVTRNSAMTIAANIGTMYLVTPSILT